MTTVTARLLHGTTCHHQRDPEQRGADRPARHQLPLDDTEYRTRTRCLTSRDVRHHPHWHVRAGGSPGATRRGYAAVALWLSK
jgi:hypothetical protein